MSAHNVTRHDVLGSGQDEHSKMICCTNPLKIWLHCQMILLYCRSFSRSEETETRFIQASMGRHFICYARNNGRRNGEPALESVAELDCPKRVRNKDNENNINKFFKIGAICLNFFL